jgi:hypothetical protein
VQKKAWRRIAQAHKKFIGFTTIKKASEEGEANEGEKKMSEK